MTTPKAELKRGIIQFIAVLTMLAGLVAATYILPPKRSSTATVTPAPGERTYRDGTFLGYSDATDHGYAVAMLTLRGDTITYITLKEITELSVEKDFETYEYPPSVEAHRTLPRQFMERPPEEVEGISGATASTERYRQAVERALAKARVDAPGGLMDGTYQGRSKADHRGYGIARVTLEGGKMSEVLLKGVDESGEFKDFSTYPHEPSVRAHGELPERFLQKNSPDIDNFSGATHSTDKYKEAVQNALAKADTDKSTPALLCGTYVGTSDADSLGYSKAFVTAENGRIVDVKLVEYDEDSREKDFDHYSHEPSVNAHRQLPWSFILTQSSKIDAVSGATYSSLHYRQAVERALQKARVIGESPHFDGLFQAASDEDENGYGVALVEMREGSIQSVVLRAYDGDGQPKDPATYPHEPYRRALEDLPPRFVKANSPEVDGITGATRSSDQFIQAVSRAVQSAR